MKTDKSGYNYLDFVRETFIGSKIKLGYQIKQVIGVGNFGTTFQVYDLQRKEDVVLKIYHNQFAMNSAINEYKMLHAA
jgi:serine/threonine protein kinase